MSFRIVSAAWAVKGLSPAAKLVLVRLADMANDQGVCWPSYASIARDCEIDRRSVRRIVASLEAAGIVRREARHNPRGLQASNWLTVCPPDDRKPAEEGGTGVSSFGGTGVSSPPDRAVLPLGGTSRSSKSSLNHQENLAPAAGFLLSEEEMARYRAEARPGETRAQWLEVTTLPLLQATVSQVTENQSDGAQGAESIHAPEKPFYGKPVTPETETRRDATGNQAILKREEKRKRAAQARAFAPEGRKRAAGGFRPSDWSDFQRKAIRQGQTVEIAGEWVMPKSEAMHRAQAALEAWERG